MLGLFSIRISDFTPRGCWNALLWILRILVIFRVVTSPVKYVRVRRPCLCPYPALRFYLPCCSPCYAYPALIPLFAYPVVHLFFFFPFNPCYALYFLRLPCCALIFIFAYHAVALIFLCLPAMAAFAKSRPIASPLVIPRAWRLPGLRPNFSACIPLWVRGVGP